MANIKAEKKQGCLESIYDSIRLKNINDFLGVDPSIQISTLEDALIWFQQGLFNQVKTGKIAVASSGYQLTSVQFEKPAIWRDFIPDEMFSMARQFRVIYKDAVANLKAQNVAICDQLILDTMMADDRMQEVRITHGDYALLRQPWSRLA